MDDNDEKRGPWESREWEPAEPEPAELAAPQKRPPALAGWIGAACLLFSGASHWTHDERPGVVGMALSAFMLTAGAALVFILVRRFFVPPEKDGRA